MNKIVERYWSKSYLMYSNILSCCDTHQIYQYMSSIINLMQFGWVLWYPYWYHVFAYYVVAAQYRCGDGGISHIKWRFHHVSDVWRKYVQMLRTWPARTSLNQTRISTSEACFGTLGMAQSHVLGHDHALTSRGCWVG